MSRIQLLLAQLSFKDILDIIVVAIIIYQVLMIIRGTRAVQMLFGVGFMVFTYWIGIVFKLFSLTWILEHFFDSFLVIAIVLFQDQLRSTLATVGSGKNIFKLFTKGLERNDLEEVVELCRALSKEKVGCLVVFERSNGLGNFIDTGTLLNSQIHSDLLYAIFQSKSNLHDGAVIIKDGIIKAGGCFLPLSKNIDLDRHLGTRHRAALGITELTDSIAVTVSEETGKINVAIEGHFYPCKHEEQLRTYLGHLLNNEKLNTVVDPIKKRDVNV